MATLPAKVKLSAGQSGSDLTQAIPRDWAFLLSEANLYRSRDAITLVQRDAPWYPGMLVSAAGQQVDGSNIGTPPAAGVAGDIDAILCHAVSTQTGPRAATVVTRDCEVIDAYLIYGTLDPTDVRSRLSDLAIHVRQGVLSNVVAGTFDAAATWPPLTGIPPSPIVAPPATQPTYPKEPSYAPSTLEATEPDMPAAGSPDPAPPVTLAALVQQPGESAEAFAQRQEQQRQEQAQAQAQALERRPGETDEQFRVRQEAERQRLEQERARGGAASPPPEAPRT
jgi:hypothetical protein